MYNLELLTLVQPREPRRHRDQPNLGDPGKTTASHEAKGPDRSLWTIGAIMGLSWQQGPLGRNPNGTFLSTTPMPERVLYMEPLRRRMSVELGGSVGRGDRIVADTHAPLVLYEEVERITNMVSFYPEKLAIAIDGERLEAVPGQNVLAHRPDRNLSVDEIVGIQLVEEPVPTET